MKTNSTFVPKGNQSLPEQRTGDKQDLGPLAPPYCDPDLHFDPEFREATGGGRAESVSSESATGLNPFPGWTWPDDEFVVDL